MLERRLCIYNAGLKVDASREILTVVMTSYYENVRSCKRHTVVRRVFCFGDALCSFLALRLTTVSLDIRDHGGLGISSQQYHPKTSFTCPIQQFGSVG